MSILIFLFAAFANSALFVGGDETPAAYAQVGQNYHLVELNGAAFPAAAHIIFSARGGFSGAAPCNQYSGRSSAPYPWFEPGNLATTKRLCPDMAAEERFLTTLSSMTLIEFSGPHLILSNDAGAAMLFEHR